jgi:hypothetical protein
MAHRPASTPGVSAVAPVYQADLPIRVVATGHYPEVRSPPTFAVVRLGRINQKGHGMRNDIATRVPDGADVAVRRDESLSAEHVCDEYVRGRSYLLPYTSVLRYFRPESAMSVTTVPSDPNCSAT